MSVAQRVAEERARLARERGDGGAAGSASKPQTEVPNCDPEILPQDITPAAEQVEAARAQASASGKSTKTDANNKLRQVVGGLDFRLSQYGRLVYCHTTPTGKFEVLDAESTAALDYITLAVAQATGTVIGQEVMKRELAPIRALARQQNNKVFIHNRIAPDGHGGYLVDLGNSAGEVAHITRIGWSIKPNPDVAFRRGGGYGELRVSTSQEQSKEAWSRVTQWLESKGIRPKMAPVVGVLLCEWLRPDTPNPLAELLGAAGLGKTTAANQLSSLVDPTVTGALPSTKLQESEVAAAVSNRYIIGYDNAGGPLQDSEQDLCCKIATGTLLASRLLYAQGEEHQVKALAPIIVTAIVPVITRADARSRTIQIVLEHRVGYEGAGGVAAAFDTERAELTSALFTLLAAGLAGLPAARIRTYTHRLADFDQLGEAITMAVGWQPGQFQEAMREHRREAAEEQASAVPVVVAVRKIIAELGASAQPGTKAPANFGRTTSTANQYAYVAPDGILHVGVMLKVLHMRVIQTPGTTAFGSERSTKNALEIHAPTLMALGIEFNTAKNNAGIVVEFRT